MSIRTQWRRAASWAVLWSHLAKEEEEDQVVDVPEPQITPKKYISERILPVPRLQEEIAEVIQRSVEGITPQEHILERTQIDDIPVPQMLDEFQEYISERMHEQVVDEPVCRTVGHAEFPQTLHINKVVVDLLVVMQRQVPRIQTSLMTLEVPPAQFVGRVMEAPMACVRWHAQNAAASPRASRTTHAMNVASTTTSENVPHASGMRAQYERRLHRRPGFHGKFDVDVGEVATGGDFIPMTSLFFFN